MKPIEQLVAAIRELRFAIDRLSDAEIAEAQPTAKHALEAQARALQADIERLLEEMGAIPEADAFERDLIS
jgi:prefoldin subunit 5